MLIDNTVQVGTNFYNNSTTPGDNITEIFAPTDNANGVLIRTLTISAQWSSTDDNQATATYVYADTSAPSSVYDTTKRMIFWVLSPYNNSTGYQFATSLPYPVALPSGYGLWITTQGGPTTTTAESTVAITWDDVAL